MLAAGPIVQDLSRSFDAYWNNERAYPVQSLVTREELDALRDEARSDAGHKAARTGGDPGRPTASRGRATPGPTAEQRARAWDEKPMDLRTATFVWAPAVVLVDKPAKIPADAPARDAGSAKAPGLVVTQQASAGPVRAPASRWTCGRCGGRRRHRGRRPAAADRPGPAAIC